MGRCYIEYIPPVATLLLFLMAVQARSPVIKTSKHGAQHTSHPLRLCLLRLCPPPRPRPPTLSRLCALHRTTSSTSLSRSPIFLVAITCRPTFPTPTPLRPRFLDVSMSIEQRFRGSMSGHYEEGTMTMAQAAVLMERSGPSGPSVLSRLGSSLGKIQIGFEWHSV